MPDLGGAGADGAKQTDLAAALGNRIDALAMMIAPTSSVIAPKTSNRMRVRVERAGPGLQRFLRPVGPVSTCASSAKAEAAITCLTWSTSARSITNG